MPLLLSVIIPTHNPNVERLRQVLRGLSDQTLPSADWEVLVVDNASSSFPQLDFFASAGPWRVSVVPEPLLGLTSARRRGLRDAQGEYVVMVDDDNVLAPTYLAEVVRLFQQHPRVGALGGKSLPAFETPPPAWTKEFHGLLAVRDLGAAPQISAGLRPAGRTQNEYPTFAPIGAGLALRRVAGQAWLHHQSGGTPAPSDRRGSELTSGGDNDMVLTLMEAGWEVGYFPTLALVHLIPAARLEADYLARLNRGIQQSWMQVLAAHGANPWPAISPTSAALRKAKAWLTYHPWSSNAARIRWQGTCGHFDGRRAR